MSTGTSSCSDECLESLRRLEAYLDGELEDLTKEQLRSHLATCGSCTDQADLSTQLRELVRQGCVDQAPQRLRGRILAHLDELSGRGS